MTRRKDKSTPPVPQQQRLSESLVTGVAATLVSAAFVAALVTFKNAKMHETADVSIERSVSLGLASAGVLSLGFVLYAMPRPIYIVKFALVVVVAAGLVATAIALVQYDPQDASGDTWWWAGVLASGTACVASLVIWALAKFCVTCDTRLRR